MMHTRGIFAFVVALSLALPGVAIAQDEADLQAAARAYQQGQRAQLRGEHGRAGELFELADSLAPSPQALRSAIRNHRAAGNDAWAATLALLAFRRPGVDADSRELAQQVLSELEPTLGRVILTCQPACSVVLDEQPTTTRDAETHELFVAVGEHSLQAAWDGETSEAHGFEAEEGRIERLRIDAPAPAPVEEEEEPVAVSPSTTEVASTPVDDEGGGITPIVFFVGLGLSAAAGGLYLWSLLDTLSLRDEYVAAPTMERYDDGVSAQTRTIVIGSIAAGLAAATLTIGIFFTRWSGGDDDDTAAMPGFWIDERGGGLTLAGTFGGGS